MNNLFPIPPDDLLRLKHLTRNEGLVFLETFELPNTTTEKLLNLCLPDAVESSVAAAPVTNIRIDPNRPKFICAAYITGASQHQIAEVFNIKRQTIYGQLRTHLPNELRSTKLLTKITMEQLLHMRDWYYSNTDYVSKLDIASVATLFLTLINEV